MIYQTEAQSAEKYRMTITNQSKSVHCMFRTLPWSLQVQIVNKSSNIIKYSPQNEDHWWSPWSFWQNTLNGETNFMCTTVTSQCDHFVTMVINHWHLNHSLWLVIDLHIHRSRWICYMPQWHVSKVMEHVRWHDQTCVLLLCKTLSVSVLPLIQQHMFCCYFVKYFSVCILPLRQQGSHATWKTLKTRNFVINFSRPRKYLEFAQKLWKTWNFNSKPEKNLYFVKKKKSRFTFQDVIFKIKWIYVFVTSALSTQTLIQSQIDLEFHCIYLEITWKIHGILCHQRSGNPASVLTHFEIFITKICMTVPGIWHKNLEKTWNLGPKTLRKPGIWYLEKMGTLDNNTCILLLCKTFSVSALPLKQQHMYLVTL